MKAAIVVVLGLVCVIAEETYDKKYDNFDIAGLLKNERLLQGYVKCFLDKGPCPPMMLEYKEKIPEILRTRCGRCSERQKELLRALAAEMQSTHPALLDQLKLKYDPDHQYEQAFKELQQKN